MSATPPLGLRPVAVSNGDESRQAGTKPVRQAIRYRFLTDGYGTGLTRQRDIPGRQRVDESQQIEPRAAAATWPPLSRSCDPVPRENLGAFRTMTCLKLSLFVVSFVPNTPISPRAILLEEHAYGSPLALTPASFLPGLTPVVVHLDILQVCDTAAITVVGAGHEAAWQLGFVPQGLHS
ncbi:hypothetical protein B0H14DRAFT_2649426 [Mycena olivaceomarginata]|nr:hypothetical protein B0H14DRAFT_2649426 [Mycena olivaceomarginata]